MFQSQISVQSGKVSLRSFEWNVITSSRVVAEELAISHIYLSLYFNFIGLYVNDNICVGTTWFARSARS